MISNVHATFEDIRNNSDSNEFHNLYSKVNSMAGRAGKAPLTHFFLHNQRNFFGQAFGCLS